MSILKFKKSTNAKDSKFAGQTHAASGTVPIPAGTKQQKWTDTKEILSPGLMIAYHDTPGVLYPTKAQRELLLGAASAARRIMRKAVWNLDKVVFFRRNEGQAFTNIMNYHFGLAANRPAGLPSSNVVDKKFSRGDIGATDRRWALNKIREGMLSISFHLNTGMYLIDCDNPNRTVKSGAFTGAAGTMSGPNEEGYCTWAGFGGFDTGLLSAWRNGEIHVAFKIMHDKGYSYDHFARVIIHEAAHKYLGVKDQPEGYAHQADYDKMSFPECIDNADSFAWAAVSLDAGHLIYGKNSKDSTARHAAIP